METDRLLEYKGYRDLWLEFSGIQMALDLNDDRETVDRFALWLKSGDEFDAWS